MPMIDVYATAGTFKDSKTLARDLAETLMKIEQVPNIPMFRKNTAAFVHDLPDGGLSNVDGDGNYVRVQVLTNAGALDRDKQVAVVRQFTDLVAAAASPPDAYRADVGAADRGHAGRVGPVGPRQHQRRARRSRAVGDRQAARLKRRRRYRSALTAQP